MIHLPTSERVLLGPGPSMVSPRVMRAMAAPVLSHLDPDFVLLLDDVRARLGRVFRAPEGSLTIATSGTGTSGMETAVANLVDERTHALAVVTGYFGDRLTQMLARYGATVTRLASRTTSMNESFASHSPLRRISQRSGRRIRPTCAR